MIMIKICLVALASVILISLIRSYKPEFTVMAVLGSSILMLLIILESVSGSFTHLIALYENLSYGKTYFPVILKSLAIAYVTEFTSAICRDAGEKSIASKVELAGKISIFYVALPVFVSLIELLNNLI